MTDYKVNLDVYHGPMDLLIYLVRKEELDIHSVPISKITEQYVRYVELLTELNPNISGEFLVLAATLMEIKTRALLPAYEGAEDGEEDPLIDPRVDLVQQLLQYKQFKDAAEELDEFAKNQSRQFPRSPSDIKFEDEFDLEVPEDAFTLGFIGYEDSTFYSEGVSVLLEDKQLLAKGTSKAGFTSLWMISVTDPANFTQGVYRFMLTFRFDDLKQHFSDLASEYCDDEWILGGNDTDYYPIELNIVDTLSSTLKQANFELDCPYQFYLTGKYGDAKTRFEAIIVSRPNSIPARIGVSLCLEGLGQLGEAEQKWGETINLLDNNADLLMCDQETQFLQEVVRSYLANCYEAQDKLDDAEAMFVQCIELLKRPVYGQDRWSRGFGHDRLLKLQRGLSSIRDE